MISYTSKRDLLFNGLVLGELFVFLKCIYNSAIGIFGGVAATGTALKTMIASEYSTPCWWSFIADVPLEHSIPNAR